MHKSRKKIHSSLQSWWVARPCYCSSTSSVISDRPKHHTPCEVVVAITIRSQLRFAHQGRAPSNFRLI